MSQQLQKPIAADRPDIPKHVTTVKAAASAHKRLIPNPICQVFVLRLTLAAKSSVANTVDRRRASRLDAPVTDILFYHLERQPLERVLPQLVQRTLERGWRAVIETDSDDRVEALSAMLWTYADEAFLPNGTARDGHAEDQPVWITAADDNPNGACVRFFVGGAEPSAYDGLERVVLLFDGADADAVERARRIWKEAKGLGHEVSYWQQDERGRWQNRAQGSA